MPLPPYSYVPGHEHPHPVTDPRGHSFGQASRPQITPEQVVRLPVDTASRRRALAALLAADPGWLSAIALFNEGYAWESHEAWEQFWNVLGRTTPAARQVQGLIHLAAACVKIREGRPAGVARHAERARQLIGGLAAASAVGAGTEAPDTLGLDPESLAGVLRELEHYRPACWHTARVAVVRVLATELRLAE
jgi:transposase